MPTLDISLDECSGRKGPVNSCTSQQLRIQLEEKMPYSPPTYDQGKQVHEVSTGMLDIKHMSQAKFPQILDEDHIRPVLSFTYANVLQDEGPFQRHSVGITTSLSNDVSQSIFPSHDVPHHSIKPRPNYANPLEGSTNSPDPGCQSELERIDWLIRSKKLRGNPRRQILNPKTDSEVSATTRKRRAKKQRQRVSRQKEKENREKRIRCLETSGVESSIPCGECYARGRKCIRAAPEPPFALSSTSESTSTILRSDFPTLQSNTTYAHGCTAVSPAPQRASNKTFACSACRKHRTRCRKTRKGPDGPCDACCNREDKAIGIPESSKLNISSSCLHCIKHRRACKTEDPGVGVEQSLLLRSGNDVNSFPEYTNKWFDAKLRSEQKKILQYLIDTPDLYLRSGMARSGGPCTRCLSLGLQCMAIKPGSKASILSPNTVRCSNCLGGVGAGIDGPWKMIRKCCSAGEGQILSIATSQASRSDLRASGIISSVRTTKIPLKDTDDGNATRLQEFRRRSARNIIYPLPKEALCHQHVSRKMNDMFYWVQKLSFSAFMLSTCVHERRPLSDCELSLLERSTADQAFPTVLDALQQLLGVSTTCSLRSVVHKLSLEAIPYMQVVSAVASMTVYNVIFQVDPFADDLQTALLITILEQDENYDPCKAGLKLQWHHIRTLDKDQNFKAKLSDKATAAGELIWKILEPLITLGLSDMMSPGIEDCRKYCAKIGEVAVSLNAEIKARYMPPQIFWPISGNPFDDDCFEDIGGSNLLIVQLAMMFGIKKDHPSADWAPSWSAVDSIGICSKFIRFSFGHYSQASGSQNIPRILRPLSNVISDVSGRVKCYLAWFDVMVLVEDADMLRGDFTARFCVLVARNSRNITI